MKHNISPLNGLPPNTNPPFDPVRTKIINYARQKYVKFGFVRVPVETICSEMRIGKNTFYKHFKNRGDLVEAILDDNFTVFSPLVTAILSSGKPVPAVLEDYFLFCRDVVMPRTSAIFLDDIATHMPHIHEKIIEFRRGLIAQFEDIIARGIKEGCVRNEIKPRVCTCILIALIDTVFNGSFLRANDLTLVEVIETTKTIFLSGVSPPMFQGKDC